MERNRDEMDYIGQLLVDAETYREAVRDARNALADAERELDEVLELNFGESEE